MARYLLGQPVRLETAVRDVDGALANAGGVTLTVLKPDGTQQAYGSPANPSTGTYRQDVPASDLTQVGAYQYKWVTTGANAGVSTGSFDVADPFDFELLSLEDAKKALGKTSTTDDDEIEMYVAAATEAIESYIGAVGRRTTTEVVYSKSGVLLLATTPVLSLTSVTPYGGIGLTVGSLVLNPSAGVVYPGTYGTFTSATPYTVVYAAGRASVPASVNTAARMLVQKLAETQRGPAELPLSQFQDDAGGGTAFAFLKSYGVLELLAPYRLGPAVA